jgi:hypothetical protein
MSGPGLHLTRVLCTVLPYSGSTVWWPFRIFLARLKEKEKKNVCLGRATLSIAESSRVFTESTALVLKPHPHLPSAIKVSKPIVAAGDSEGCSELCFHGACGKLVVYIRPAWTTHKPQAMKERKISMNSSILLCYSRSLVISNPVSRPAENPREGTMNQATSNFHCLSHGSNLRINTIQNSHAFSSFICIGFINLISFALTFEGKVEASSSLDRVYFFGTTG